MPGRRQALADALDVLEPEATEVVLGALRPIINQITAVVRADLPVARTTTAGVVGLSAAAVDGLAQILTQWGMAVNQSILPYFERVYKAGGLAAVARLAEMNIVPSSAIGSLEEMVIGEQVERFARNVTPITDLFDEAASRHLALSRNRWMGVGQTVWANARTTLLEGMEGGLGVDQIARNLREVTDTSESLAKLMARTEVVSAANAGAVKRMELAGDDAPRFKVWLSTIDSRTRPAHVEADGQTVPRDAPFLVAGRSMQYPGDIAGGDENVYNCRCSLIWCDDETECAELVGEEGRQEGGVLEDVAEPGELPPVPEYLQETADNLRAFRAAPRPTELFADWDRNIPSQALRVRNIPSQALRDYEALRTRVGTSLDDAIRARLPMRPTPPSLHGSLRDLEIQRRADAAMAEWTAGYQVEMRKALKALGTEFDNGAALVITKPERMLAEIKEGADRLPARWIDSMNEIPITTVEPWHSVAHEASGGASFYDPIRHSIVLNMENGIHAVPHELSHHAQMTVPRLMEAEWVHKFERESVLGEWNEQLERYEPVWADLSVERISYNTRPDNYPSSYMGKSYNDMGRAGPQFPANYELWTTASEPFLSSPVAPGAKWQPWHTRTMYDLDLVRWVLGILATI